MVKRLSLILLMFPLLAFSREHQVQRGETFESISQRYGVTVGELREANPKLKGCYAGLTLKIPEIKREVKTEPVVASNPVNTVVSNNNNTYTQTSEKTEQKKQKVNGWEIAKGIIGILGSAAETYANAQVQNHSQSNSQVLGFVTGLTSSSNQSTQGYSNNQGYQSSSRVGLHSVNPRNPSHHYIIAQNNQINYSFDPKVIRRYQEMFPNCIVDVMEYEGHTVKNGYYRCKLCHGSLICNVCKGRGYVSSTGQLCGCNGTGKCMCNGPEASSINMNFFGKETVFFPGWELAFNNIYDKNGIKLDGENFAKQERESRQSEREKRQQSMASCSVCHGTGINPTPTSLQPIFDLIGVYHSGHEKCSYCSKYSEHWHSKCTSCMGKVTVR